MFRIRTFSVWGFWGNRLRHEDCRNTSVDDAFVDGVCPSLRGTRNRGYTAVQKLIITITRMSFDMSFKGVCESKDILLGE